jgi:hypothetical protein
LPVVVVDGDGVVVGVGGGGGGGVFLKWGRVSGKEGTE